MRRATALLLVALALAGCREDEASAFRSDPGPVPETSQREGDATAGYTALLNAPYVSCGIPYDAYRAVSPETSENLRLPDRSGRNSELPYALTAHVNDDGVEIVSSNCLTCHAMDLDGEIVIGLGNAFADFTGDPRALALQAGSYVRGEAETRAWTLWADRIEAIGPYIQTRTVGANPATNLTWALMSHFDPETLEWSNTLIIEPPPVDPLPISVPPWWTMGKKNAMFYTTIGRGDQSHFMLLASMLCMDGTAELDTIDGYAPDIRAYIRSLEAPKWPHGVDADLAARGEAIFARDCAACHGTYGEEETYPNIVYGLDEVGTDPAYATEATNGARDRFYEWIAASPYGDTHSAAPAPGYIAPPLDGVWATAPYLHNGSVPTLETLLHSPSRPMYWRHETDPRRFDASGVGWAFEALRAGQADERDRDRRRTIYDTTLYGYGNGGHTYSDGLSAPDRAALLEYLKTL